MAVKGQCKYYSDVPKVIFMTNKIEKEIKVTNALPQKLAEEFVIALREKIASQDPSWKALKVDWLLYKKKHGYDERMWIMTGELYNKLKAEKMPKGWFAGALNKDAHIGSGLSMGILAGILEYQRPLFRIVKEEFKKTMDVHIKNWEDSIKIEGSSLGSYKKEFI